LTRAPFSFCLNTKNKERERKKEEEEEEQRRREKTEKCLFKVVFVLEGIFFQ
jgi:hypothetical protein